VLDRFHREGVRFSNFYVQPVCSPVRTCLIDTWVGVSLMRAGEEPLTPLPLAGIERERATHSNYID
jgi:hypothetical protein